MIRKKPAATKVPRKTGSRRKAGAPGQANGVTHPVTAGRKSSSRKGGGIDHGLSGTHAAAVDPDNSRRKAGAPGHVQTVTQAQVAGRKSSRTKVGLGHNSGGAAIGAPVQPELIESIFRLHRERRGLQCAVGDMNRRIKADERWAARMRIREAGGTTDGMKFPIPTAEDKALVKKERHRYYESRNLGEKLLQECLDELLCVTAQLPVAPWIERQVGCDLPSLAAIVGEAGDLSNYAGPAKLWKRMSLHVINGQAARRIKGDDLQEYVARRRSEMQVIGYNFERAARGSEYRELYLKRKAYELRKLEVAGVKVLPAARIPKAELKSGKYMAEGQVRNRALRYVEKRFLRNLWRVWTGRGVEWAPPAPQQLAEAA